MRRFFAGVCPLYIFCILSTLASASEKQPSLLQVIGEWRFPDSEIQGAQISDAETVDANRKRTAPSTLSKTIMKTDATIEEVLKFYRDKLQPELQNLGDPTEEKNVSGRSVSFSDDSEGRPFAIHTIMVNTKETSTTLVITRGKTEAKTHIAWKQYRRFDL